MNDFRLSCCKLLEQYPLYHYCTPAGDHQKNLYVLLIGSGTYMETILHKILSNGQLLDTALIITVITENGVQAAEHMLQKAPDLGKFVTLYRNGEQITVPGQRPLASIYFDTASLTEDAVSEILVDHCESSYIIISTENDEQNYILAEACSQLASDLSTLIAYVQTNAGSAETPETKKSAGAEETAESQKSAGIEILSPRPDSNLSPSSREKAYRDRLEQIAFNLHYAYAKSQNERKNIEEIEAEFQLPYNYVSNMEAAVHIHAKLASCNIQTDNSREAARQFARLMEDSPEIIERLSALEHNRWVMEKLLQGYTQLHDLDKIYSTPGVKTHDSGEKWHCCLVTCDESGKSHLNPDDWKCCEEKLRPDLDPLDRMSLLIHNKCGELARKNRPRVEELLNSIQNALTGQFAFSHEVLKAAHRLELAIGQMWQQKKSTIPLYEKELNFLKKTVSSEEKVSLFFLNQSLELLEEALAPLVEYISYKDYKALDRLLVQQIPFALTHKRRPVLLKLLAQKEMDDLFSAWQLEPSRLLLLGSVSTPLEMTQYRGKSERISRFLTNAASMPEIEYHFFMPQKLYEEMKEKEKKNLQKGWTCFLHAIDDWSIASIETSFQEILQNHCENSADYLDITGGDPFITRATEIAAEKAGIPVFYINKGSMLNLYGAEELEYPAPRKGITVREMFDLSGAVAEEDESETLSDLSRRYKSFWKLAQESPGWKGFCSTIARAYKNIEKPSYTLSPLESYGMASTRQIFVSNEALAGLIPALRYLERGNYLKNIAVTYDMAGQNCVSFIVPPDITSPAAFTMFLQSCTDSWTPSSFYSFWKSRDTGYLTMSVCDLNVSGLQLEADVSEEYRHILAELAENDLILDYQYDEESLQCSFRFASKDILTCLQNNGTVLEYYIYYSALLDGHFNDVSMGWRFLHSSSKNSVENEIDVICTRNTTSLFISAKMTGLKQLTDRNQLNYILYEISLLANRFGINAKPVLAAPAVSQFQINEQTGKKELGSTVTQALKRGVYLLGKECFEKDVLGQILDRIAEGKENWCQFLM